MFKIFAVLCSVMMLSGCIKVTTDQMIDKKTMRAIIEQCGGNPVTVTVTVGHLTEGIQMSCVLGGKKEGGDVIEEATGQ